jgi:hypothetical protein
MENSYCGESEPPQRCLEATLNSIIAKWTEQIDAVPRQATARPRSARGLAWVTGLR